MMEMMAAPALTSAGGRLTGNRCCTCRKSPVPHIHRWQIDCPICGYRHICDSPRIFEMPEHMIVGTATAAFDGMTIEDNEEDEDDDDLSLAAVADEVDTQADDTAAKSKTDEDDEFGEPEEVEDTSALSADELVEVEVEVEPKIIKPEAKPEVKAKLKLTQEDDDPNIKRRVPSIRTCTGSGFRRMATLAVWEV